MQRISLPETAHILIRTTLGVGEIAIDATVGNGHDTLFLAECVGESGHVYGFDIQAQALEVAEQRLQQAGLRSRVTWLQASHADMGRQIPERLKGKVRTIMFNLGYLPGADKSIITQSDSTLQAVNAACDLLADRGVMTIMAYPGHGGGDRETRDLEHWLTQLDFRQFSAEIILSRHHRPHAPRLFVIRKIV